MGLILGFVSMFQYLKAKNSEEKQNAQVKIWMQDANGISTALNRIVVDNHGNRYSNRTDIACSVWAVQSSAFTLYQSLYEERCVTEKEYKERQKKLADKLDEQQESTSPSPSPSPPDGSS